MEAAQLLLSMVWSVERFLLFFVSTTICPPIIFQDFLSKLTTHEIN